MNISEIVIQIQTCYLEDGSLWHRMSDIFKNEWLEWVKLDEAT